jgi:hypothetical protein
VSKLKSYAFENVLRREMRDKEFAAEYEALGKEYELAKEFVRLRKAPVRRSLRSPDLSLAHTATCHYRFSGGSPVRCGRSLRFD